MFSELNYWMRPVWPATLTHLKWGRGGGDKKREREREELRGKREREREREMGNQPITKQ